MIYASGDLARGLTEPDHPIRIPFQHAILMGVAASRNAVHDLLGLSPVAYAQPFYATRVDLGSYGAVFTNVWNRQIGKTRAEGTAMKALINMQCIYPPSPSQGRAQICSTILGGR
ncbi:NADH dehydrogenase [Jannaschia faecimaris]|uniref:NADH dehydrogenase n=1 Tax=Jannaschia faecimaris TaxID=1244108 RepID=A0A1H3TIU0_9RHOB|nr:hypothetical protein [Jannaschia faecimaris]SDZ49575.1 NADH dehydrogenase [Jannaschia faecimaris]